MEGTVGIFIQGKLLGLVEEFLLGEHTVFDDNLHVVPLGLEIFAVFAEHFIQFIRDLFGDVRRDLLHIAVGLEVGTAHVQWDVR